MTYEIECYINTINSEGAFSIHGTEGYCLEKGDKTSLFLFSIYMLQLLRNSSH